MVIGRSNFTAACHTTMDVSSHIMALQNARTRMTNTRMMHSAHIHITNMTYDHFWQVIFWIPSLNWEMKFNLLESADPSKVSGIVSVRFDNDTSGNRHGMWS